MAASAELYTLATVEQAGIVAQCPVVITVTISDDGRALGAVTHRSDPTRVAHYEVAVEAMRAFLDALHAVVYAPDSPPCPTASANHAQSRGSDSPASFAAADSPADRAPLLQSPGIPLTS
jgi:hypothetical protein